jgi:hypothetical protein
VAHIEVSCLYGGDFWGFTYEFSGWVNLGQMLVMYDTIAFAEEYQAELYSYDGDYKAIEETRSAVVWPWPGADYYLWTVEDMDTEYFRVSFAWKDMDGREWGYVPYIYGSTDVWICLSDPLNHDIPAFNLGPGPIPWVSETEHTDIKKSEDSKLLIIIVIVAAVVVGTLLLIKVLWKKPGKNKLPGKSGDF